MNKMVRNIPDFTPLSGDDLRIFPFRFSWFVANILLMLVALGFGATPLLINHLKIRPDVYMILLFGGSIVISVLCIFIIRGHLFPVRWLQRLSTSLLAMALISALLMFGERRDAVAWVGGAAAILSLLILTHPSYHQIAQFYKRMMERQRSTGLTRAEDIMIHLMIEEGTKDSYENARQIVINAAQRIKKSPR